MASDFIVFYYSCNGIFTKHPQIVLINTFYYINIPDVTDSYETSLDFIAIFVMCENH